MTPYSLPNLHNDRIHLPYRFRQPLGSSAARVQSGVLLRGSSNATVLLSNSDVLLKQSFFCYLEEI